MVRLLGLAKLVGELAESPREITRTIPSSESIGESGWLIRFFDSAFFCEWIAVSYLYKHAHPGVRDYLCNRMYTLPLPGIESYLFQICYMLVHKPSPSLDKFVIDTCSKSLKIALKVHWFLMAELEDSDDNEGISRIQEKCQIAATLMGEWHPLIRPQNAGSSSPMGNQVLHKLFSSKQKLLSLTSSNGQQRSMSFSPSSVNNSRQDDVSESANHVVTPASPRDENKVSKKFIPGAKMWDNLLFRKSIDKEKEETERDGVFKRLLRVSRDDEVKRSLEKDEEEHEKESFFKRFLKDNRHEDLRKSGEADGEQEESFFKRCLKDSRNDDLRKSADADGEQEEGFFNRLRNSRDGIARRYSEKDDDSSEKDGFFKRFLRDSREEEEDVSSSSDGFFKRFLRDGRSDVEEKAVPKSGEDDGKERFLWKFFKDRIEEKKDICEKSNEQKVTRHSEDDEKEGFFKKMFKERFEDKKESSDRTEEDAKGQENGEEDEPLEFSLFRRLFRVHPEDSKGQVSRENTTNGNILESSPGTEKFFRKLFRDRDRSVEDSELFGSKKNKEKCPGSPKQGDGLLNPKPPLPNNSASHSRKGAYHESLDFVQSLCDTSYGLVDVFPVGDRKTALHESLAEINAHIAAANTTGGVCFPMGKGLYRVVHIPEDEAVLLNSREKAPYLICVEVLKCEVTGNSKDASTTQKLSKGGIPLANGDAMLPKPPPWAYPVWNGHDTYHNSYDRMSTSTSQAIDEAMGQLWEAKVKFVSVNLSVDKQSNSEVLYYGSEPASSNVAQSGEIVNHACEVEHCSDLEWVRVVLTADPGVSMDDIVDQEPPRKREHRRVPSTVAFEEVKAAALKGEAPPGLPLKGAGQDSSEGPLKTENGGMPRETDALSGELWDVKKERICIASEYGKLPGWDLRSVIVKSGDDCRQEHLAVQLISHFYDIFQEAGLPLWLRPYEVLVTSSYTALIETIPDTASIHSIKSRYPIINSLREFFAAKYQENSPNFKLAQLPPWKLKGFLTAVGSRRLFDHLATRFLYKYPRNFVESMAGYSLVCYLLQIKDRHNGNLLLDEEGHIIHIDFGFMLSNSPGGVNFESAPFKLTRELLEVMDSDAEGVPSEFFDYFKVLCIQGFLTCRKHAERIILLVEMVQDSGFPCFKGGVRTIQNLRKRFHLSLTEEQCVSLVLSLISSSLDAWRTRQYDYYQRVLNGIL